MPALQREVAEAADQPHGHGGHGDGCDHFEADSGRRSGLQGLETVASTTSDGAAGLTVAVSMVSTRDINAAKPAAK